MLFLQCSFYQCYFYQCSFSPGKLSKGDIACSEVLDIKTECNKQLFYDEYLSSSSPEQVANMHCILTFFYCKPLVMLFMLLQIFGEFIFCGMNCGVEKTKNHDSKT